jgi:hypothetical protein
LRQSRNSPQEPKNPPAKPENPPGRQTEKATEAPERLKICSKNPPKDRQKEPKRDGPHRKRAKKAILTHPPVRVNIPLYFAAFKIPDKLLKKPFPRQNLH